MAEFHINKVALGARKKHPTYFGFTETGWMNSETWRVIIRKFHQEMCQQYPGMEPILLLDQLNVHLDDESLRFCVANKIHVGFFPAHCTHFLQPSDDAAFSTFKKGLEKEAAESMVGVTEDDTDLGGRLVDIAMGLIKTITPEVIKASWKGTGLSVGQRESYSKRQN